jgi:hypothetical protein
MIEAGAELPMRVDDDSASMTRDLPGTLHR